MSIESPADRGWHRLEQSTILEAFTTRLNDDAHGPFLDICGKNYTAAEFDVETNRVANGLSELGVGRNDRVASLLENCPEAVVFWLATLKLGAIAVPINAAYKGQFLLHPLTDASAKVLVIQGDLVSRLDGVSSRVPSLEHVVHVGDAGDGVPDVNNHAWKTVLEAPADEILVEVSPPDLATLVYTGGTTGPSKGCMLSHNYCLNLSSQIMRAWDRRSDDVVWTPLPLFHFNPIACAVIGTMLIGGSASVAGRFSVSGFWPEMRRSGATVASLLGAPAVLIVDAEDHPDQQGPEGGVLRMMAAAPLPPVVEKKWQDRFGVRSWSGGYGVTEALLLSTVSRGVPNKPGAAGRRNHIEFDVRIFDEDDQELGVGEVGEIVARPKAPHVMFEGYWGRAESTIAVTGNLWFHTGDLGLVDEDDYLFFVDRKKDYLRRRGENISSQEMEATFLAHPDIAEVAVHSVLSDVTEDEVKVTAVLRSGARLSEEDLCRWSVEHVPYFAVPRYIEFREILPKTPLARVQKFVLRDEGVTANTWDRELAGMKIERR
jgi:crotonobetaine/carnitine-CoA ligase